MFQKILLWLLIPLLVSCEIHYQTGSSTDKSEAVSKIDKTLDRWHQAAADADFKTYFNLMSDDAVFVGTDASEVWDKPAFMKFAKPYFDKRKAWNFKKIKRHIYLNEAQTIAWFDETLNTWMGVCRGAGVLQKTGQTWQIKHYVLSLTIPNDKMKKVISVIQQDNNANNL